MPTNNPAEIPMPNTDWDTMENDVLVSAYAVAILNTNAEYADAILDVILRRLTRAEGLEGRVIAAVEAEFDNATRYALKDLRGPDGGFDDEEWAEENKSEIRKAITDTFAAVRAEGETE